jgi:hypothetical protein
VGALVRPLSINDMCARVLLNAAIHAATYLSSSRSRKRSGGGAQSTSTLPPVNYICALVLLYAAIYLAASYCCICVCA